MSVAETNTGTAIEASQARKPGLSQSLVPIAFFATVGIATVGWGAFLVWIGLAVLGF